MLNYNKQQVGDMVVQFHIHPSHCNPYRFQLIPWVKNKIYKFKKFSRSYPWTWTTSKTRAFQYFCASYTLRSNILNVLVKKLKFSYHHSMVNQDTFVLIYRQYHLQRDRSGMDLRYIKISRNFLLLKVIWPTTSVTNFIIFTAYSVPKAWSIQTL